MAEFNYRQTRGLAELHKALQQLPVEIERKLLQGALRAGLKEMQAAAKANVPVKSGALRDSIKVRVRNKKDRWRLKGSVVAGNKTAYYAHMVEFGTAAHLIKPKNRKSLFFAGVMRELVEHPGAAPKPFMRPAFDAAAAAAINAFADKVRTGLLTVGKP